MTDPTPGLRPCLLMVLGTSPAVVTETLYELEKQHRFPGGIPCIDLVTTSRGYAGAKEVVEEKLRAYAAEYAHRYRDGSSEPPTLRWHIPKDADGREIEDLTTAQESQLVGETIFRIVRDLCSNPSVRVFASIAGGRKTMSYYMGLAMALFARPQDTLLHVLVPPALEQDRTFFYPRTDQDSTIWLPELPFPRLRGFLERQDPDLYRRETTLSELIEKANRLLGPWLPEQFTVVVDKAARTVSIQEVPELGEVVFPERHLKMFDFLVALNSGPRELPPKTTPMKHAERERRNEATYISEIKRKLETAFGRRATILSTTARGRHRSVYSLPPGMRIHIRNLTPAETSNK